MRFYQLSPERAYDQLKTNPQGLTRQEAVTRLKKYGPNQVRVPSTPLWRKLLEPLTDVFTIVLLTAAAISFWHGANLDGTIILIIIAISAIILYIQRFSTERVLKNLNRQTIDQINVIRGNQTIKVDSTDLVPGDIVLVTEGEKIPADIRLTISRSLRIDESVLTGESQPVRKNIATLTGEKRVYERANLLFSGSFVVSGSGQGIVVTTGNNTEFGNIASLSDRAESKSPVQKKIDKLVSQLIAATGAVSLVILGLSLLRGMELFESLRFVIALAISAIPEGLPIAISVILVLGMRRMAAKKALVQQMRAIETLGVITTIATDKTGTLTENKLRVQEVWQPTKTGKLKTSIDRFFNRSGNLSDPLDQALMDYARKDYRLDEKHAPAHELPFDQDFAMSATVWHSGEKLLAYVKGAPESILKYSKASASQKSAAQKALDRLTAKGYRVLATASGEVSKVPKDFKQLVSSDLKFTGLIAVADSLRPEAKNAIKSAIGAGVTVRMITGDHPETAFQIGKNLGMVKRRNEVLDCGDLDKLSDSELEKVIDQTKVFARVIPEQKYRLLSILKKHNITAMTGDGVNDVPALTNAHVGLAMGSGSHIARDAGGIILLDDNFKTVIDAMREGRVIISNIRRMLFYLLATNTGEVLTMMGALIIGTRLPLEPVQILWVNLITDTSMVIPLGLEPGEKDVMKKKPLKLSAPILNRQMIIRIILAAISIAAVTLVTYLVFSSSHGHAYAQTLAFAALVVSQWGNAFSARSDSESIFSRLRVMNRSFYVGLAISLILQLLVFFGPLGGLLHIAKVSGIDLLIVSIVAFLAPIIVCEIHKITTRRAS